MMELFTEQEAQAAESMQEQLSIAEDDMRRADEQKNDVWGAKLTQISERKLYGAYRLGCTFEEYLEERWEMSKTHAYRLMAYYQTKSNLSNLLGYEKSPNRLLLPTKETHTRPLEALSSDDEKAQVWKRVIEQSNGAGITAKVVKAEVSRYIDAKNQDWITLSEWEAGKRWHGGMSGKSMNKVNENIEWAQWSWNPITGCLHNCAYCYARDIAERFYESKFEPSYRPARLDMPSNTKQSNPRWAGDTGHRNVFTCSMADLFGKWVPEEWITQVIDTIAGNPQWTFLLLTKFPIRMAEFDYPENVWLGTSVDRQPTVARAEKAFTKIKDSGFDGVCWLSCEPMLEPLTFGSLSMFDWVVMGGASKSTQTPEYKPDVLTEIIPLTTQAKDAGCMVYWKTNLMPGLNDDQRLREYPNVQTQ